MRVVVINKIICKLCAEKWHSLQRERHLKLTRHSYIKLNKYLNKQRPVCLQGGGVVESEFLFRCFTYDQWTVFTSYVNYLLHYVLIRK